MTTKSFNTPTRISLQVNECNLENDIISAIKEYVSPKVKTAMFINPPLAMYSIIPIIQNKFKSSLMNLVLVKSEIENVKEYFRQQEIIRNYHDGKTNHRGITECYLALSKKSFWLKMKEQIAKFIGECTGNLWPGEI